MTLTVTSIEKMFADFHDYWESLRIDQSIPLKSEWRPENNRALLPYISIDEYKSDTELISRIRGTNIVNRFGEDFTGQNLFSYFDEGSRNQLMASVRKIVTTPCAARSIWIAENNEGRQIKVLGRYLPLCDENHIPRFVIGVSFETEEKIWTSESKGPVIALTPRIEFSDIGFGLPE